MSDAPQIQPAGWYYAQGDPPGTQRYWDGQQWEGGPQPVPGAPQSAANGVVLGEPVNRIAARLIDYVLWIVVSAISNTIFGIGALAANRNDVSYVAALAAGLLSVILIAGYEIFMVGSRGATLGKLALGLKVTRAADGSAPDYKDAAMRMSPFIALSVLSGLIAPLSLIISLVLLGIGVASLVLLFTDPNRQTLWDKIAKTRVVSTK
jgi:uncharacterized RDD family membrane protein YckC